MMFKPGSLPDLPTLKTNKALLLIDLQNDFVSSTGRLNVSNTSEFVPKLPALIEKFRENGLIVWCQSSFQTPVTTRNVAVITQSSRRTMSTSHDGDDDYSKSPETSQAQAIRSQVKTKGSDEAFLSASIPRSSRCCIPLSHGAELPDNLSACMNQATDLVFAKSEYSALSNFSLVMQLRARMVTDLYICGSLSNIGVYATVYDAVQQGFSIKLIEDCLGYRDGALHLEAMRRMADQLCAEGIDYQELMDDLYGLLGDVIPGTKYIQQYEVSLSARPAPAVETNLPTPVSSSEKITKWMDEMNQRSSRIERPSKDTNRRHSSFLASEVKSFQNYDSPDTAQKSRISPRSSPARKRSTSDRDSIVEQVQPLLSSDTVIVDTSEQSRSDVPNSKKSKIQQPEIQEELEDMSLYKHTSPTQYLGQSHSASHVQTQATSNPVDNRSMSQPILPTEQTHKSGQSSLSRSPDQPRKFSKTKSINRKPAVLTVTDQIGDGDSHLVRDILPQGEADAFFHKLKSDVAWQTMYHRTGAVPRLVAVQGIITDNAVPIYRHPADESPPLLEFDPTVAILRKYCESIVKHPLNHVLIQHYRTGEDNISEHSDKTIDIVRGSSIVNLSLGAMRTMTLRTKKSNATTNSVPDISSSDTRQTQRIPLPHNSVFVLGQRTNANWLHSIRADKRPDVEKSEQESAYGCERISLTFRHIGTFHDVQKGLIWGQGATGTTRADARKLLQGEEAEKAKEAIIVGFGKENHLNEIEFDWEGVYGRGFDVVSYIVQENSGGG